MGGHSFSPLSDSMLKDETHTETAHKAQNRSEAFWEAHRPLGLTTSERRMDEFEENFKNMGGSKILTFIVRALVENYIETDRRKEYNKLDIGPVLSTASVNSIDGLRTRIGGQTTAHLHPHLFSTATTPTAGKAGKTTTKRNLPTRSTARTICHMSFRCAPSHLRRHTTYAHLRTSSYLRTRTTCSRR